MNLKDGDGQLLYERKDSVPEWSPAVDLNLSQGYTASLSYFRADANLALLILCLLGVILLLLVGYVILYGRLFVQSVAEPVYMMDRGLRQWNYNLAIPEFKDRPQDEISRLANIYNRRWLPLKERIVAHYDRKKKDMEMSSSDHGSPLDSGKNVSLDELI